MDNSKYKIKIVKECYIDAESDTEAEQIADILVSRESRSFTFGGAMLIFSETERVGV